MKLLDYEKKLVLREHDVKKIVLRYIRYGTMSIWDIGLSDLYKFYYTDKQLKHCTEKGYPVLLNINGKTRLLIFDRPIC